MNETIKILLERRSVRGYKEDLVPEEVLNEILEAGEYAPSGMGQQGTLMVVTQNPELVAKLSKMNADVMGTESDPFYGAPTVVVVFADSNMPTCVENGSLVMGNLMNAAHALGVDSCWIHRAREVFASEEGKALKAEWGGVLCWNWPLCAWLSLWGISESENEKRRICDQGVIVVWRQSDS